MGWLDYLCKISSSYRDEFLYIFLYRSRDNQNSGKSLADWHFPIVRWRNSVPETLAFTVHGELMCLNNSQLLTVNVAWNQAKCEPIPVSTHSCKMKYHDSKYILFCLSRNVLCADLRALWVSARRCSYQAIGVLWSKTKRYQCITRAVLFHHSRLAINVVINFSVSNFHW